MRRSGYLSCLLVDLLLTLLVLLSVHVAAVAEEVDLFGRRVSSFDLGDASFRQAIRALSSIAGIEIFIETLPADSSKPDILISLATKDATFGEVLHQLIDTE